MPASISNRDPSGVFPSAISMDSVVIPSPDELDQVERLLRERLVQGYCLLERSCPACTTPLVRQPLHPAPTLHPNGQCDGADDSGGDIAAIASAYSGSSDGSRQTAPIVAGVPYCVKCSAHVVSQAAEIDLLDNQNNKQDHFSRRKKGVILVTTVPSATSPKSAVSRKHERHQYPDVSVDSKNANEMYEPLDEENEFEENDRATHITYYTHEIHDIDQIPINSYPPEEYEILLASTRTIDENRTDVDSSGDKAAEIPKKLPEKRKNNHQQEMSSKCIATVSPLWDIQQPPNQMSPRVWHFLHHQSRTQNRFIPSTLAAVVPSQLKGIVVPGTTPTAIGNNSTDTAPSVSTQSIRTVEPELIKSGTNRVVEGIEIVEPQRSKGVSAKRYHPTIANNSGKTNREVDGIEVIDCAYEEDISLLDANTMEDNGQVHPVVVGLPPNANPNDAQDESVVTVSSRETAIDIAIKRNVSVAKSLSSSKKDFSGQPDTPTVTKQTRSTDFPMPDFKIRRELAIKVLAAKMVQGFILTDGAQCGACRMPMMHLGHTQESVECFVCRALQKQYRKSLAPTSETSEAPDRSNANEVEKTAFSAKQPIEQLSETTVAGTVCVFGKDVKLPNNKPIFESKLPLKPTTPGIDVVVAPVYGIHVQQLIAPFKNMWPTSKEPVVPIPVDLPEQEPSEGSPPATKPTVETLPANILKAQVDPSPMAVPTYQPAEIRRAAVDPSPRSVDVDSKLATLTVPSQYAMENQKVLQPHEVQDEQTEARESTVGEDIVKKIAHPLEMEMDFQPEMFAIKPGCEPDKNLSLPNEETCEQSTLIEILPEAPKLLVTSLHPMEMEMEMEREMNSTVLQQPNSEDPETPSSNDADPFETINSAGLKSGESPLFVRSNDPDRIESDCFQVNLDVVESAQENPSEIRLESSKSNELNEEHRGPLAESVSSGKVLAGHITNIDEIKYEDSPVSSKDDISNGEISTLQEFPGGRFLDSIEQILPNVTYSMQDLFYDGEAENSSAASVDVVDNRTETFTKPDEVSDVSESSQSHLSDSTSPENDQTSRRNVDETNPVESTILLDGYVKTSRSIMEEPDINVVNPVLQLIQSSPIAPTASELFQERWAILRAEARSVLTRRMLSGWGVLSQKCEGVECNHFPLVVKGNEKRCVVCGGAGSGEDGIYRYSFSSHISMSESKAAGQASESRGTGGHFVSSTLDRTIQSTECEPEVVHTGPVACSSLSTRSAQLSTLKLTSESMREAARNKIGRRLFEGWTLLDKACPICVMPLMIDLSQIERCMICGIVESKKKAMFSVQSGRNIVKSDELLSGRLRQHVPRMADSMTNSKAAKSAKHSVPLTVRSSDNPNSDSSKFATWVSSIESEVKKPSKINIRNLISTAKRPSKKDNSEMHFQPSHGVRHLGGEKVSDAESSSLLKSETRKMMRSSDDGNGFGTQRTVPLKKATRMDGLKEKQAAPTGLQKSQEDHCSDVTEEQENIEPLKELRNAKEENAIVEREPTMSVIDCNDMSDEPEVEQEAANAEVAINVTANQTVTEPRSSMAYFWPWIAALKSKATASSEPRDPPASHELTPSGLSPKNPRPEPPESSPIRCDSFPERNNGLVYFPSSPGSRSQPRVYEKSLEPPSPTNQETALDLATSDLFDSPTFDFHHSVIDVETSMHNAMHAEDETPQSISTQERGRTNIEDILTNLICAAEAESKKYQLFVNTNDGDVGPFLASPGLSVANLPYTLETPPSNDVYVTSKLSKRSFSNTPLIRSQAHTDGLVQLSPSTASRSEMSQSRDSRRSDEQRAMPSPGQSVALNPVACESSSSVSTSESSSAKKSSSMSRPRVTPETTNRYRVRDFTRRSSLSKNLPGYPKRGLKTTTRTPDSVGSNRRNRRPIVSEGCDTQSEPQLDWKVPQTKKDIYQSVIDVELVSTESKRKWREGRNDVIIIKKDAEDETRYKDPATLEDLLHRLEKTNSQVEDHDADDVLKFQHGAEQTNHFRPLEETLNKNTLSPT